MDARRHFVGQKAAVMLEELDGQHSDVFERFENPARNLFGRALDGQLQRRSGRKREPENTAAMVVFHKRVKSSFAVA